MNAENDTSNHSALTESPAARGSAPLRRFGIAVRGGGDTIEEVIELLRHVADELEANKDLASSTFGGCGHGGHYDVEDRGEHITPATFRSALAAWMRPAGLNDRTERPAGHAGRSQPE